MNVQLHHISKTIGKAVILEDIRMELHGGVVYGFSGKNGCGKTMLMRCISGLMKPTSGAVILDGKQLWRDLSFPESIGMLLETPSFLPHLTGFDNLALLAAICGVITQEDIARILREVGLDPEDRRKYRKYSLGMKQRLGIAAALMESPALIILDEPINALDASGVEEIRALIIREKERGALIIVACHDKEELHLLADEIFYLESGRLVGHEVLTKECEDHDSSPQT